MSMNRNHYKIFSEESIAGLTISNRLIRSATWDPSILNSRQMTEEVLNLYRALALGGVGAIITGGLPVYRERFPEEDSSQPFPRLRGLARERCGENGGSCPSGAPGLQDHRPTRSRVCGRRPFIHAHAFFRPAGEGTRPRGNRTNHCLFCGGHRRRARLRL